MNKMRAFFDPESQPSRSFVVGIGASSTSLEALGRFFDNVPTASGMAFVIVGQPEGGAWTFADELLAKHTRLPILHVTHGTVLSADHVYLVPAETPMILSGGRFVAVERGHGLETHSIDIFLHALAEECGPNSAAVVLSGGGADGSRGLSDVHDAGGLVVVQRGPSGPRDAAQAPPAGVDWVLPAAEIPRALADHAKKRAALARPSDTLAVARAPSAAFAPYSASELLGTFGTLLDTYLPPSLLLTATSELIHSFGGAGRLLGLPGEAPGMAVLDVVHPDLRSAICEASYWLAADPSRSVAPIAKGVHVAVREKTLYDVAVERVHGTVERAVGALLVSFAPRDAAQDHKALALENSGVRRLAPPAEVEGEPSSTEDLESLLSSLPDAVYFKDARGRFLRANQAMADRLGLAEPRDAIGKTASEVPNVAAATALHRDDDAVLQSGEAQHFRLERWEATSGAVEWALVTRLPLRNRAGDVVGMIGVFHDVTEQKRAEEKVQEAVRRRDQFLAMLSHELRNPLGAIVTATALLKKQLAENEHARPLAILQRQSLQMARLLDDLLEANRVTENTIELKREVVDLRAVATEAAEGSRTCMEARRVAFAADLGREPLFVDGDPARLQQIQVNLLQNAAKYTAPGGHVTLALTREADSAVLRVRDDGAGIPKEMLESVFELFVQGSRKLDRSQGGMGLGLTLVRSLVAMHGGTVSAHSDGEGKGAEFVVRLPLVPAPAVQAGPRASARDRVRRLPAHAKIAVVEDSADNRDLLVEALSSAGFECRSAENGVEGLALIDAWQPDVAIVDLGLPALNGYEIASRVRAEPRHVGVRLVALSGYGMREDRARALAAGFDDHLVKPIEPSNLVRYLESEGTSTSDTGPAHRE
jgi:PAS domain S-box-containing protein